MCYFCWNTHGRYNFFNLKHNLTLRYSLQYFEYRIKLLSQSTLHLADCGEKLRRIRVEIFSSKVGRCYLLFFAFTIIFTLVWIKKFQDENISHCFHLNATSTMRSRTIKSYQVLQTDAGNYNTKVIFYYNKMTIIYYKFYKFAKIW